MRKKIISAVLIAAVLTAVLASCGASSSPKALAEKYFDAVKAGDLEAAIECYKPSIREKYSAAVSLSDTVLGVFGLEADSGALLGELMEFLNTKVYKDCEFKVTGTKKTDREHAYVTVEVYKEGKLSRTTTVWCVKTDGEWYIEK